MYIAMYCLGAIAAIFSVVFRYKQYNASPVGSIITETVGVTLAVLVAKLSYGIETLIFEGYFSFSGIRLYGAIFAVPILCLFFKKLAGISWSSTLSLCTPGLAIATAFARVGCQYAGCCGGPPVLIGGSYIDIPEQLIEGIADLSLFFVLLYIEKKGKKAWLYPVYLMSYAILRFFLDFLRDSPIVFINLTLAQMISIVSIILAFVWMLLIVLLGDKYGKKENK